MYLVFWPRGAHRFSLASDPVVPRQAGVHQPVV